MADLTPDELLDSSLAYKFFYLRRTELGMWERDALVIHPAPSLEYAIEMFRGNPDRDIKKLLLAGILRGNMPDESEFQFGHEPDITETSWYNKLKEYDAQAKAGAELQKFTVLGGWDSTTPDLSQAMQVAACVDAINAEHAELLARSVRTAGTFLVAAVVWGEHNPQDFSNEALYASIDGNEPAPVAANDEPEPRKRNWMPLVIVGAIVLLALIVVVALL
jgi:hypothetical protein